MGGRDHTGALLHHLHLAHRGSLGCWHIHRTNRVGVLHVRPNHRNRHGRVEGIARSTPLRLQVVQFGGVEDTALQLGVLCQLASSGHSRPSARLYYLGDIEG